MRSSFLPKCQPKITKISALPSNRHLGQKSWQFLVGFLGETMISWIHSEFNWPWKNVEKPQVYENKNAPLEKISTHCFCSSRSTLQKWWLFINSRCFDKEIFVIVDLGNRDLEFPPSLCKTLFFLHFTNRTLTIITCSLFETGLDLKPWILSPHFPV